MEFSSQLRLILLLAGALTLVAIYLLGKRHGRREAESTHAPAPPARTRVQDFGATPQLDDDEFDTPAYLRRGTHEVRQQTGLPTVMVPAEQWAHADDVIDDDPVDDKELDAAVADAADASTRHQHSLPEPELVDEAHAWTGNETRTEPVLDEQALHDWSAPDADEPAFTEHHIAAQGIAEPAVFAAVPQTPLYQATDIDTAADASHEVDVPQLGEAVSTTRQPVFALKPTDEAIPVVTDMTPVTVAGEPLTFPAITADTRLPPQIPVVEQSVAPAAIKPEKRDAKMSKRKIIALRLAVPGRVLGEQLLSMMQRENLQHGRFDIFHRLHDDAAVFSVASMVEPGTFDLASMREQHYPGITFFMLLPGPLDGLVAYDQMLSCAQRLAHFTEGALQDERGNKLTSMTTDRLRDEVLDFQHLLGSVDVVSG